MGKILKYFHIGDSLGGQQKWFHGWFMREGGCAAKTACELMIFLELTFGMTGIYPYDVHHLTREDFVRFGDRMKPYLRPRMSGIDKTSLYIEGVVNYLKSCGWKETPETSDLSEKKTDAVEETRKIGPLTISSLQGTEPEPEAARAIQKQIDEGYPVPYLMLNHHNLKYDDFMWHWFTLAGYEQTEAGFYVRAISYGKETWFRLEDLWRTGLKRKGGIILLKLS